MITPGDIVITNVSPTSSFDAKGDVVRMTNVEFTVRGKGPFSRQMPTDSFDPTHIKEQIRDYAERLIDVMDYTG